jgi:diguanylate cyclase (GGDEF)-like protein/PAS domain S-box-containing protein
MDGEEFPVEVLLTPITVGEKTIIHTVWQDITGRKKIEGELKISEERHRKIIEHAGDIVYRISLMGYFEYVNPQAELLTGYSEDELIGMLFVDLVHPDWRDRVQEFYLDQRNQKIAETTFQLPIITKAGDEKWIEQIVNLIVEGESRISLQGIARDITRRKHAEEREQEQRNLAEALRKSAEALNQSLSLDEVLKIIVENAMKMVSCDSASITWVLDTDVRIVEYRGLGEEQESWFMDRTFQLDEFATYKKVVQDKKPLIIQDTTADPRWIQLQHTEWIRSHLEAPVIIDGKVIAIISLDSKVPGFYNKEQARNLQAFANQAAVAIHKASLFEEIQNLATTDDLTSLYNRRGFYEISRREVGRLQRYGRPFSVLFIDIDLFKQFNDQYSYAVGDQVLQWVADLLQSNVREIDVVGRYGGEEIVILLPEIDNSEAEEIAERIRIIIEKSHFSLGQDKLQITVSIGVATLSPTPEETILTNPEAQTKAIEDLIAKAGDALHKAKQQGRNRVVTYES